MTEQPVSRRRFLQCAGAAGAAIAVPATGVAVGQTPFSGRLPKAKCTSVINADTLVVEGIGNIALLGIRGPDKDSEGYQKAVDAVVKYANDKDILIDQGPQPTQTADGRYRALVYYNEDGVWYNLNTKMLRAGLASAVSEPRCHVNTSGWVNLVREAKANKRGLYHLGVDLPERAKAVQLAPEKRPVKKPTQTAAAPADTDAKDVPAYRRPYVTPEAVSVDVKYVGSILTKRFHRPECLLAPKELDRVLFEGRLQAIKNGFRPCLVCRA